MDTHEDQMLASSLHAFEAARSGRLKLPLVVVRRALLVVDGSDQQPATRAVGAHLAARAKLEVMELEGLSSGDEVLREAGAREADLIVLPAPFREPYQAVRERSLGSAVDVLLHESTIPTLLVREPASCDASSFSDVLIPISISGSRTALELAWALALAPDGARVEILDVPDLGVLEEAKHLLGDAIDADALKAGALERAASRECGRAAEAAREAAGGRGVVVELRVASGNPLDAFGEATRGRKRLVVSSLPGGGAPTPELHRARDIALRSPGPVLLV